jgi:hypothetical protein
VSPDNVAQQAKDVSQFNSITGSTKDAAEAALQSGASGLKSIDLESNAPGQETVLSEQQGPKAIARTSTTDELDKTPRKAPSRSCCNTSISLAHCASKVLNSNRYFYVRIALHDLSGRM